MKFNELVLNDIRSYGTETPINFEDGANLIYGANGAGKSTILQGVFGGLFQTDITRELGGEFTLDNLVRKQSDEGEIKLTFEIGGVEYTVEWKIKKTTRNGDVRGKTKSGYPRLSSPDMDETISGFREVNSEIRELIGMDATEFVNSVYVQQGDITRLIHADTEARREILDGLLGLHRLDELMERMDEVRLEYKSARGDAKARRNEVENRLDELPDEDDIEQWISGKIDDIEEVKDNLDTYEDEVDQLEERRDELNHQLDRVDDLEDEIEAKEAELRKAKKQVKKHKKNLKSEKQGKRDAESELSENQETLSELREEEPLSDHDVSTPEDAQSVLDTVTSEVQSAKSEKQTLKEGKLSTLETEIKFLKRDIGGLKDDLSDAESLKKTAERNKESAENRKEKAKARVSELEDELSEAKDDIHDVAPDLGLPAYADLDSLVDTHIPERRKELSSDREDARQELGRLETLQDQVDELADEGECPVCGSSEDAHDISPEEVAEEHAADIRELNDQLSDLNETESEVDELESDVKDALEIRDELDDERETVEDATDTIGTAQDKIDELSDEINEVTSELEEKQSDLEEKQDEQDEVRDDLSEVEDRLSQAKEVKKAASEVVALYDDISDLERDVEQHEENIQNINELRDQAQKTVVSLKNDISDLQDERGELSRDELKEKLKKANSLISKREAKIDDAEDKLESLRGDMAELKQKRKSVRDSKERREMLEDQYQWADERRQEAVRVKNKYKEVRGKLRQQNLRKLNEYTNEMFSDLYQSQSYRGVKIDKDYNLYLVAEDGELIEPELSSGGESTILNLALRAGVYRIIAERNGVAGAALPPLILDEPTTYLDSEHIGELQTMIDTINEWDVPQVLVVSHNEQLIENSDTAFFVEKDPNTKTSRVTANHSPSVSDAPADD